MEPLRCVVSVSGIRGIVGETIDPAIALALAGAFAERIAARGTVVLGRDSRPTGEALARAVAAGLRGAGSEVVDLGVVPPPTVAIEVGERSAAGGIQISASHNPVEWNALKFFDARGRNIDSHQLDWLLAAYAEPGPDRWCRWADYGRQHAVGDPLATHLARVLAAVDRDRIAARGFKIMVDSVNGAGSVPVARLMEALGVELVAVNDDPARIFPRDPEPTAENVGAAADAVAVAGADVGFVQDPDADRLAVIDERGRYLGEEYTLVLCAASRLAAASEAGLARPVACTNLSTSRMIDDVAARHGGRVVRTPVGEANVVDAMQEHDAVVGGEGNGGVIDPRVVWGRDSHIGMALILEHLARHGIPVSEAVAEIPAYEMRKVKLPLDRDAVAEAIPGLRAAEFAADADIDERDGIKLSWPDRWVHLRASGTEPASRLIAEGPDAVSVEALVGAVRDAVHGS